MMNIIVWIAFGALAGWIASLITRTNEQQDAVGNIVTGIIGAVLGGFVLSLLGGEGFSGFNALGLLTAVMGAVILIGIMKSISRA